MGNITTLRELYLDGLRDIYDAENRIVNTLPKVAKAASDSGLRDGLQQHLEETKGHVKGLEQVFGNAKEKASGKTCDGMKGILAEGESGMSDCNNDAVRDAGIIAAAQRVEHYEMAVYGSLRTWADQLGDADSAQLL